VETVDSKRKKKFKQVFKNNMGDRLEAVITPSNSKSYTKITFTPDLQRYGRGDRQKEDSRLTPSMHHSQIWNDQPG